MTTLNRSTRRRLKQLNQIPSVWEGDRRPLSPDGESDTEAKGDCILWVDGSQGVVRAIDMVTSESGPEAVVRTLLRAMEYPQGPVKPARPQKIVVRDREIQFFLRGVLQELDIAIEHVPTLPLIDELFREFQENANTQPPQLPPQYADRLMQAAYEIWNAAPWEYLEEHQIVSIELNRWDIGTLYVSVMGMSGMEYGILLYRSLDSLKRFRATVLQEEESLEKLEEAFLGQDCLFVTFESAADLQEDEDIDLSDLAFSEIEPNFGNIHPLEGLRASLFEEEALILLTALEGFNRFLRAQRRQLAGDTFPSLSNRYRISVPQEDSQTGTQQASVKVATLPDISKELLKMIEWEDEEDDEVLSLKAMPVLRDDLVPQNSFLSIGMVSWEMVEYLRMSLGQNPSMEKVEALGDGLPVILIQTSRPKAKTLIEKIQAAGGVKGIFFNPGEDPFEDNTYDLGIIQTNNEEMHVFGEFIQNDPIHAEARKKWDRRCKKTKGHCALLISKGLTGASRGNPQLQDMMALFEARSLSHKELGLGTLQRMLQVDWE
ncbi:hypothetical protein H6S82_04925 [Planktothrix sp. FACHB-1355]|uniref:Uncharacterized protein n=1 Tax=Aerosakkonema funiforme FACHB-1375 TaxID=2949571 RepID=A0A926VG17_9CYAN|nr:MULTISPECIES: hypothetical protein [Oscillatoriales]MBD2181964.1 hypothetical protein [Aerosakkonema funiforme FACHB-1375]MBD3558198.1 hypothetical protein [Planktothrix sp. FACHB-1355]